MQGLGAGEGLGTLQEQKAHGYSWSPSQQGRRQGQRWDFAPRTTAAWEVDSLLAVKRFRTSESREEAVRGP